MHHLSDALRRAAMRVIARRAVRAYNDGAMRQVRDMWRSAGGARGRALRAALDALHPDGEAAFDPMDRGDEAALKISTSAVEQRDEMARADSGRDCAGDHKGHRAR